VPTRTGLRSLLVAGIIAVFARAFAVPEAYAIAVAIIAAVGFALTGVYLRPIRLMARRWAEPTTIHAGERAQIFLEVTNRSRWRSPPVKLMNSSSIPTLRDPALRDRASRTSSLWIPSLRRNAPHLTTEILDTSRRGLVTLPVGHILREDPLGLVARPRELLPPTEVMILPRIGEVAMPVAGAGVLGELLMRNAQRLGLGEFDGLREYVDGDDPRSIHWRASARTEDLMVRQFTVEGARRCTVVLDRDALAAAVAGPEAFEVAVEIAATLVVAAEGSGLATRFVISGGDDLSGTAVSAAAITALTLVQPGPAIQRLTRDGSDGLGILIIVTTAKDFPASRARALTGDLALVPIRVIARARPTDDGTYEAVSDGGPVIHAANLEQFLQAWRTMVQST
jgi:uncharacterized protein (DUF58 family)